VFEVSLSDNAPRQSTTTITTTKPTKYKKNTLKTHRKPQQNNNSNEKNKTTNKPTKRYNNNNKQINKIKICRTTIKQMKSHRFVRFRPKQNMQHFLLWREKCRH
jgi:hypothetical protein